MRGRFWLGLAVVAIGMTACSSGGGSSSAASAAASGGSGLTGKVWQLTAITTKTPAFQGVVPAADSPKYTIEFKADGTYGAKADCNNTSGSYTTTSSGGLTMTAGPTTLAMCPEGSLSSQYIAALPNAKSYAIAGGQLTITGNDEGTLQYQ